MVPGKLSGYVSGAIQAWVCSGGGEFDERRDVNFTSLALSAHGNIGWMEDKMR